MADTKYIYRKEKIAKRFGVTKARVTLWMKEGAPIARTKKKKTYWTVEEELEAWLKHRLHEEINNGD